MQISGLGLHLTDRCNARCQHCAYHCGPRAKGVMGIGEACGYLHDVAGPSLELVCISGGEPLLYPDVVTDIVRKASIMRVPGIWIFTNASWAVNSRAAERKLGRLKEAGMTRVCLSADGFHQPFIPVERVCYAITAARDLGLQIVLDSRYLGSPHLDNPTNRITRQVLRDLGDLKGIETWQGQPLYTGRGADTLLGQLTSIKEIPKGECPGPWAGGTWENPVGVDVDLYGEVTLCPGLSVGNAKKRPLTRILADYAPEGHPIIRELVTEGPRGLAEMAKRRGYVPRASYVSECHLCYDVRRFLRSLFSSELAPRICYQEPGFSSPRP